MKPLGGEKVCGTPSERDSVFRFYDGSSALFDNLSLWIVPFRAGMEMKDRRSILNYPKGRPPIAGSFPHIFQSIESLPNLSDPFFHMATVTPAEGIRCVYSLIFENAEPIHTPEDDLPAKSLVILALESLYLHPLVFHQVLYHFYNSFTSGRLFTMDHTEIEEYARSQCESGPGSYVGLVQFPGDITPETEIGRLQHFAFACFRVKQIVSLVFRLLVGDQIVVTSIRTDRLSIGCFAVISLLLPIQWSQVFIPLLPDAMRDYLGSPFPFMIGIPFRWIEDDATAGMDCCVVNLDLGFVSAERELFYHSKYVVLAQKIGQRLQEELNIYKHSEIFPGYRIRLILWQLITGIMAITAGMTAPGKMTIASVAENLLALGKRTDDCTIPKKSYQKAVLESMLVTYFAEQVVSGQEKFEGAENEGFIGIFDTRAMQDLLAQIHKTKK
jgi:hypothetical protein